MKKEQLKELLSGDFAKVVEVVGKLEKKIKLGSTVLTVADAMKQYDPYAHDVNDPVKRPNRALEFDGETYIDQITNEEKTTKETDEVPVSRLQLARQMQIVQSAVFFECGADIELDFSSEIAAENICFDLIQKVWRDNKLSFKTEDIVERRMIETHCAELWYDFEDAEYWKGTVLEGSTRRPGMILLCKENGDDIFPIWDEHNDFIGLGRKYESIDPVTDTKTLHFELYSTDTVLLGMQVDGGEWQTETKNSYDFLTIVYHSQKRPEWSNTQPLADREEENLSNLADTNKYYGDSTMVIEGDVETLPSQGETAKVIQVKGENGAKGSVSFVQPEAMVESKKLEMDIVKQEQFDATNTPDISFGTMSKLMSNGTSGIALRLLFMGPQMKGNKSQKRLNEMLVRRINVIKKMLISFSEAELTDMINVNPGIKFKDALPVNKTELISDITKMVGANLMSKRTAMMLLGEVTDVEAERLQILKEAKEERDTENLNAEK